jgi:hypothetical protein
VARASDPKLNFRQYPEAVGQSDVDEAGRETVRQSSRSTSSFYMGE